MKRTWCLLALTCLAPAWSPLWAEPGRFDALRALIEALPEREAGAEPGDAGAPDPYPYLAKQMASCRFRPQETADIEGILKVFEENCDDRRLDSAKISKALGELPESEKKCYGISFDRAKIREAVRELPQFKDRDNDPEVKSRFDRLLFGILVAPDITHSAIINSSCPRLVRARFEEGAGRERLLRELIRVKTALDLAAPPE